jgi:hypothetical protein
LVFAAQVFFSGTGDFEACLDALKPLTSRWRREDKACLEILNLKKRREADDISERSRSKASKELSLTVDTKCNPRPVMTPPGASLAERAFYGFSEFWYSSEDVLRLGNRAYDRHTLGTAVKVLGFGIYLT